MSAFLDGLAANPAAKRTRTIKFFDPDGVLLAQCAESLERYPKEKMLELGAKYVERWARIGITLRMEA